MNVMSVARVVVYDRWGGVVFERSDIPVEESAELWDGRLGDVVVQSGVYSYMVELILADNSNTFLSGSVTVVR